MNLARRQFLHLAVGAVAVPAVSPVARAQSYPTRPIRLMVGDSPGGAPDIVARLMGQWLSERLGQQIVVENRPGAGNTVAMEIVAKAPPDGYTLGAGGYIGGNERDTLSESQLRSGPRYCARRRH